MTFTARRAVIAEAFVPTGLLGEWQQLAERSDKRHAGYVTVTVDTPRRPRTTGERSQNSRHWGHCSDIAEQLSKPERVYTKRDIDTALRRMAVRDGLPTQIGVDGCEEPIGCERFTVEQADIVERVKQRFADEHELWLTEYDETVKPPVAYRSVGGRSRAEMQALKESDNA